MQLNVPPDLETLINKRLSSGGYTDAEDVLLVLCAASFMETGTDLYASDLSAFFDGDPEVLAWLNNEWKPEELQHGRAIEFNQSRRPED